MTQTVKVVLLGALMVTTLAATANAAVDMGFEEPNATVIVERPNPETVDVMHLQPEM